MPHRPRTMCKHPGCPELVSYGEKYCGNHKGLHKNDDRESSKERGYDSAWAKARKRYLVTHPLCVKCKEAGRYEMATVVDHIIPHRGNKTLFWDESNWQGLCKSCHDKKTWTEDAHPTYTY